MKNIPGKSHLQQLPQVLLFTSCFSHCIFIRSQRERDFKFNVTTQMALLKYIFALHRKNYKRWMSVSVHGLQTLPTVHPDIYREYNDNGSFMVQKTDRVFSAIPKDQAHEQNTKIFKPLNGGLSSDIALKWIPRYLE